jgi:uncharacterized protein (TIGR03663 family)
MPAADASTPADRPDSGATGVTHERATVPLTRRDRVALAVAALVAVALLFRLVALGTRSFHWDEARVGYWTLRYLETGFFTYRPVAGGPFLQILDRHVFALLGASDATARLVVALVGGLLPAAALLFRGRLRDDETVALALLLAVEPTLVYFSRFARGDVPLVACTLLAVGAALRLHDTGARRWLYVTALAVALAATTSALVVPTAIAVLAAAAVVADERALRGGASERSVRDRLDALGATLRAWATPLARAGLLGVGVLVYFFAPRAGPVGGPSLWRPTTFPGVVEAALLDPPRAVWGVWVVGREGHAFLSGLATFVGVLAAVALPLAGLAFVAFVWDRYRDGPPRPVVTFGAVWAGAALFVVPTLAETVRPWLAVAVVVPLAIPAAAGLAGLVRWGRRAAGDERAGDVAAAALLVVALLGGTLAPVSASYAQPDRGTPLADYAQPADDLDGFHANLTAAVERAGNGDGPDVVYVGESFYVPSESDVEYPPVSDRWGNRLPFPWYVERAGATTDSVRSADNLTARPPVVVAEPSERALLEDRLGDDYAVREYRHRLWSERVVVFVAR